MVDENSFDYLDTKTKTLIFWNLLVKKELTAKQLSINLKKDISTILRTLNKLEIDGLVIISKTETKRNFNLNYWVLNPDLLKIDFSTMEKTIYEYLSAEKPKPDIELSVSMFMKSFQAIISSVIENKVQKFLSEEKKSINWIQSDIFSALLVDEETGVIFHRELVKFLIDFQQKYKPVSIPLDKIKEKGSLFFIVGSKIEDTI
jgi:DNA-binding transcriptional ArsR family regulator